MIRLRGFPGGKRPMRRSTCCLLVVLLGSWMSSVGQNAPTFASPKIVATFERLDQTADLPLTTIYTPPKSGTFRISIVMVETVGNGDPNAGWWGSLQFWNGAGENQPYHMLLP